VLYKCTESGSLVYIGLNNFGRQISPGSCAGLEFKASLEKSLNFRKLLSCFGKRVEGLEKFGI